MKYVMNRISLPSFMLERKIGIVIGASEGIGRTIAESFALAGAKVILCSRRLDALKEVETEITEKGGNCSSFSVDVRHVSQIKSLASVIEERYIDNESSLILVNSAGIDLTKPALDSTESDWDTVFETHLKGTFFTCQSIGKLMIDQGYGKIINVSSTWSFSTDPNKSIYSSAKAGVTHLTSALATEWAPYGVRVNAIAPTATLTIPTIRGLKDEKRAARLLNHIPMGRFADPQDLVGAALFLASEASDFITGHTLFVDGGWRAKA